MFLQAWFENEDFREAQASGIFTKSFAALCQMGKYHDLTSLTSKDLIEQLCLRARILDVFINEDATTEYCFNAWFDMFESDSVIIHEQEQDSLKIDINRMLSASELSHIELMAWRGASGIGMEQPQGCGTNTLASQHSVKPLSVATVKHMSAISHKNKYRDMDDFSANYIYHPVSEAFSYEHKEAYGRLVAMSVNLSDYTDDEILDDLANLLKSWRKDTDTPSKPEPSKASSINLKKIINNRYILLLDGMIYGRILNGTITDELIINHVYPHLEIQPDSFRKTYKRNARAFASPQCLNTWEKTLTNLGLWGKPVQEALQKKF
jgi:hypothetical protein